MNTIISPVLDSVRKMYNKVSPQISEEFLVLRANLLRYMADCYLVLDKNLPKPEKVFKRWQSHAMWVSIQRRNPNFTVIYSGEWIKVYELNGKYYLALSPIRWTSADSIDRFD